MIRLTIDTQHEPDAQEADRFVARALDLLDLNVDVESLTIATLEVDIYVRPEPPADDDAEDVPAVRTRTYWQGAVHTDPPARDTSVTLAGDVHDATTFVRTRARHDR